jgi:hypothetical protein
LRSGSFPTLPPVRWLRACWRVPEQRLKDHFCTFFGYNFLPDFSFSGIFFDQTLHEKI